MIKDNTHTKYVSEEVCVLNLDEQEKERLMQYTVKRVMNKTKNNESAAAAAAQEDEPAESKA